MPVMKTANKTLAAILLVFPMYGVSADDFYDCFNYEVRTNDLRDGNWRKLRELAFDHQRDRGSDWIYNFEILEDSIKTKHNQSWLGQDEVAAMLIQLVNESEESKVFYAEYDFLDLFGCSYTLDKLQPADDELIEETFGQEFIQKQALENLDECMPPTDAARLNEYANKSEFRLFVNPEILGWAGINDTPRIVVLFSDVNEDEEGATRKFIGGEYSYSVARGEQCAYRAEKIGSASYELLEHFIKWQKNK